MFFLKPAASFYYSLSGCAALFMLAFVFPVLFQPAKIVLALLAIVFLVNLMMLFVFKISLTGRREMPGIFSLGSENQVKLFLKNSSPVSLKLEIVDELPVQLQKRDFLIKTGIPGSAELELNYKVRPLIRGSYIFGDILVAAITKPGFFKRQFRIHATQEVAVYPSVLEMKQIELRLFSETSTLQGIRKLRRLGHSYEFEHIRDYVQGDEYRSVNWKATGRRGQLMVNQYGDQKSQQVYCIIDVSRSMELPFDGLTLLDYAVNSTLVTSSIALKKHDRAGLVWFSSHQVGIVQAENHRSQLRKLMDALYNIKYSNQEQNIELLYTHLRQKLQRRSLIFFYTNFESEPAFERALPVLRKLNKFHLLVMVFFENRELADVAGEFKTSPGEIYEQTIVRKMLTSRFQMMQLAQQHGLQVVYTRPQELSVNMVNKYLELKSRGFI